MVALEDYAALITSVVRDLRAGREVAPGFRRIFDLFYSRVHRFFERKGIPSEDCRDLAQETFLAAFQGLLELRDEGQFPAWLFGIARNTYRNELERKHAKKRHGATVALDGKEDSAEGPRTVELRDHRPDALSGVMNEERGRILLAAFEEMPVQVRRCLQLRVGEDSSYEEIAAVMGISINTVKAHLHRGRKELLRKLSPWFSGVEV